MPKLRLSIFLPRNGPFYARMLSEMRRGFEACGVECTGALELLGPEALQEWCSLHRPHVILEMNRSGRDVPFLPSGIRHVAWIVDMMGQCPEYFDGSAITYFFMYTQPVAYLSGLRKWLGPGVCPDAFAYEPCGGQLDASFVGHIPKPWTKEELSRDLTGGKSKLTFGELIPVLEEVLAEQRMHSVHAAGQTIDNILHTPKLTYMRGVAEEFCTRVAGVPLVLDERLAYDIDGRVVRHANRCEILDLMVDRPGKFGLYGPENWKLWDRYKHLYRGRLESSADLRQAYQSSAINFHEGVGIHFRSLEVMAAGGLLFYRRSPQDRLTGGIFQHFEDGVHFAAFVPQNFEEQFDYYVENKEAAINIRKQAAEEVARRHTWTHRAEEILGDLREVG